MNRMRLLSMCVVVFLCVWVATAHATDQVTIESATSHVGGSVHVGIYFENDAILSAMDLILYFRSESGGSYPTAITARYNPDGRLPLGGPLSGVQLINWYDIPDGICNASGGFSIPSGGDMNGFTIANPSEPDCIDFYRSSIFPATPLGPGSDFPIGTGEPSMVFDLDVGNLVGSFVIDTTCRCPSCHTVFVLQGGGTSVPSFTASTITVSACDCPAQGDLYVDGFVGTLDFMNLIDVLFFGGPDIQDPACPNTRADIDGNGVVDILDFNTIVMYLFFGGPKPCNPCNPIEGSCQP